MGTTLLMDRSAQAYMVGPLTVHQGHFGDDVRAVLKERDPNAPTPSAIQMRIYGYCASSIVCEVYFVVQGLRGS